MNPLLPEPAVASKLVLTTVGRFQWDIRNLRLAIVSWFEEGLDRSGRSPSFEVHLMKLYSQKLQQLVRDNAGLNISPGRLVSDLS